MGKLGRDILSTTVIAGTMHMMQILVGLAIIVALLPFMQDLPMWLGLLPVTGFMEDTVLLESLGRPLDLKESAMPWGLP